MKKVVLVFVLMMVAAVAANAQYATPEIAKRVGCTIKLDGNKLSRDAAVDLVRDINGENFSEVWCKARGLRTTGIVMISAGAGVAVAGLATAFVGLLVSAVGAAAGGATGAIVGSVGGEDQAQKTASEAAQNGAQAGVPIVHGGLIAAALGTGVSIAGIPITAMNSTRMSRIVDKYNEWQAPQQEEPAIVLSFGSTQNGVGLRLNF